MIPLKLIIKNFVSYGPTTQTIDFGPYNLICLSGKNGHGKSALLDALTWTIWGQARKMGGTSKADEGLLRLGQTHMIIILDLAAQGNLYRIKREYTHYNNKSQTSLEFGIVDSSTDSIKSLTDKTLKATQKQIETHIGLGYDCFINSAFMRQGQSNEFSKKSPGDRKDILASILGLDHYEILKKQASEKAKEYIQQKNALILYTDRLKQELEHKEVVYTNLEELKKNLDFLIIKEQEYKDTLGKNKLEILKVLQKAKAYDQLKFYKDQRIQEYKHYLEIFKNGVMQFRSILHQSLRIGNYKALQEELELTEQMLHKANINIHEKIVLQEELFIIKHKEEEYKHILESEHAKYLEGFNSSLDQKLLVIKNLENSLVDNKAHYECNHKEFIALKNKIKILQRELTLVTVPENFALYKDQFEKRKQYYNIYQTRISHIKEELNNTLQKVELIEDSTKPSCPLCQQELTETHKYTLKNTFVCYTDFLTQRLKRLSTLSNNLKMLLLDQQKKLHEIYKNQEIYAACQAQLSELTLQEYKLFDIITLLKNKNNKSAYDVEQEKLDYNVIVENKEKYKASYITKLIGDTNYNEIVNTRKIAEKKLERLNYNQQLYNTLLDKKQKLIQEHEKYTKLSKELDNQEQRKAVIAQSRVALKKIKQELLEYNTNIQQYALLKEQEVSLLKEEEYINKLIDSLNQEKGQLLQQKGSLEEQQKVIQQKSKDYREHQTTIQSLNQEIEDYQAISIALSKDGIQALLIEQALPEIEQEANTLLARLTDNQAHLIIDSLKDLKSGKTRETLDIKISDSLGIRPYELFSGGEAFRIDFALRIAISKLLARRAGADLQTLIIDEGFGSQDEEGLSSIMECIHKIQDDFAKIIIVSHLPELKEQFPVHFLVNKGPQGSIIKVVEHG